jgi:hypothetical protein
MLISTIVSRVNAFISPYVFTSLNQTIMLRLSVPINFERKRSSDATSDLLGTTIWVLGINQVIVLHMVSGTKNVPSRGAKETSYHNSNPLSRRLSLTEPIVNSKTLVACSEWGVLLPPSPRRSLFPFSLFCTCKIHFPSSTQ